MRVVSEGPTKITKATIEAVWRRRRPEHRLIIRDRDCRGLALIANATSMAWSYAYRPRGVDPNTGKRWLNRSVTLGNPGALSIEDARRAANAIKGQAAVGGDPAAEIKKKADAARRARSNVLGRLVDDYQLVLPTRPKSRGAGLPSATYVAEEIAQLRLALAEMDATEMPAASLIEPTIRALIAGGRSVAYKRFGALSRFLDWAQDAGHIQANPCAQITRSRRPRPPPARAHYLAPAELARLWWAAERLHWPVQRDLARFLIAVPCRRAEAAKLEWSHLDLDAAEWRQPARVTKNREPHRLHLHVRALDVLRGRRAATGGVGLVFPSPRMAGPIVNFDAIKAALSQVAGLSGWNFHDNRRSFASALGEAGVPEAVADAILNHKQSATRGGTLGVYQRSSRWPEQVKAMEMWGRLLSAAIEGSEAAANVVPLTANGDLTRKHR